MQSYFLGLGRAGERQCYCEPFLFFFFFFFLGGGGHCCIKSSHFSGGLGVGEGLLLT